MGFCVGPVPEEKANVAKGINEEKLDLQEVNELLRMAISKGFSCPYCGNKINNGICNNCGYRYDE